MRQISLSSFEIVRFQVEIFNTVRSQLYSLKVRNILGRIAENGWMGPEWFATYQIVRHSGQLLLHEFIRHGPIMLKDAKEFIASDEVYLKQAYRKSTVQK